MKPMFFLPVVFCGMLTILVLSTGKAQAELGVVSGIGGNFTLTGTDNKLVSLENLNGQVVLILFGYTTCPDICATAMFKLKKVRDLLGEKANQVQIVFITLDPERDTPEKIEPYVSYFGNSTIGLTGTPQEIAEVATQYRVAYKKVEADDGTTNYSVAHTDVIYLIDDHGHPRTLYRSATPTERIVSDVLELINESSN